MAQAFTFELVSPEKLLLSAEVEEVVAPGSDGYLTIMANHAPLMTTLKPGVVEAKHAGGEVEKIFVRGGLADVSPTGFTLLAEQAIPLADLDAAQLNQEIENAQDDVNDAQDDEKRRIAEEKLGQLQELKASLGH